MIYDICGIFTSDELLVPFRGFAYRVAVILQVLGSVAVGEHQKLRVTMERDVGGEFSRNRCQVLRHGFCFYVRERRASSVSIGARLVAGATA